VLAETIRRIALLTQAFMPDASGRILDQLAIPDEARTLDASSEAGALRPGTPLPPPSGVFPRLAVEAASAGR
jgi:methionyl-tRNA synthetase